METLSIETLSLKLSKDDSHPWLYCIIKSPQNTHCTRPQEIGQQKWVNLITQQRKCLQVQIPKNPCLLTLEVWNYDLQSKVGESRISTSELSAHEKEKDFMVDRDLMVKFGYERKSKNEQTTRQSQGSTLRVNYNKSDPNLRLNSKFMSGRKPNNAEDLQPQVPLSSKYDQSSFGRWKFIPTRHEAVGGQKLKL